jgi:hypothetical protein
LPFSPSHFPEYAAPRLRADPVPGVLFTFFVLQNIGLIQKYPGSYKTAGIFWSWRQESNLQPADYKSAALPIELRQHG